MMRLNLRGRTIIRQLAPRQFNLAPHQFNLAHPLISNRHSPIPTEQRRTFSMKDMNSIGNLLGKQIDQTVVPNVKSILADFVLDDDLSQRTVALSRNFGKETFMVNVFELVHVPSPYEVEGLEVNTKDEDGKDLVFDRDVEEYRMEAIARNTRANNVCLEFGVTLFWNDIRINTLSVKSVKGHDMQPLLNGPEFIHFNTNLRLGFVKYLEMRGLDSKTRQYLMQYMFCRRIKQQQFHMKNCKSFFKG